MRLAPLALVGIATCTWNVPKLNTDGSAAHIAAYTLTYGRCNSARTAIASIKGHVQTAGTQVIVRKLASGAWCFSVIARSTAGVSSDASNVASKVI